MDILTLAILAVWFSIRVFHLTYRKRQLEQALIGTTCENIVLRETLDYARDELVKVDSNYVANLEAFYTKAHKRHLNELETDLRKRADEKGQR